MESQLPAFTSESLAQKGERCLDHCFARPRLKPAVAADPRLVSALDEHRDGAERCFRRKGGIRRGIPADGRALGDCNLGARSGGFQGTTQSLSSMRLRDRARALAIDANGPSVRPSFGAGSLPDQASLPLGET